jgi:hypothetical protein
MAGFVDRTHAEGEVVLRKMRERRRGDVAHGNDVLPGLIADLDQPYYFG